MTHRIDMLKPAETVAECRARIRILVQEYARHRSHLRSTEYDETLARQDFIDPFFAALGWDVANFGRKFGKSREVVPEARIAESRDRPDYAFNIEGKVKFFVEAKRPGAEIGTPARVFQAKTYAYGRSAPLSLLFNFEEMLAYHSMLPPELEEPHVGRLPDLCLKYEQLEAKAETLWNVLGRDSAVNGSVERYVTELFSGPRRRSSDSTPSLMNLPGARLIDQEFLDSLSDWRERLARAFAESNELDDPDALTEAVQRVLDRLVFIRVCEDRAIEPKPLLRDALTQWMAGKHPSLYGALVTLFKRLEAEYNSHLFKRHFSEGLKLRDESVLQLIIDRLYPPRSPYRFDAIPVAILGTVYERFIGETVAFGRDGVTIVPKPEVRHAGGVVYTPQWIVREIVARVLGPLIKGKGPDALAKIRVLDPACGSGSFLLGATDELFDAHLDWYRERTDEHGRVPASYRNDVFADSSGELHLTVQKRRQIITRSVFGVDKDPQAVEVAQLSLYLRILEGQGEESIMQQKTMLMFKGALLPDLTKNIRCGNSLIAPADVPEDIRDDEARSRRVRAFLWDDMSGGFGRIMKHGGFDAVVGNPPYIRIQELVRFAQDEVRILQTLYPGAADGNFDIYVAFVQKALGVLRDTGNLGYIMPLRWMKAHYGKEFRKSAAKSGYLMSVDDFGPEQIFAGVTTYTGLQFFSQRKSASIRYRRIAGGSEHRGLGRVIQEHKVPFRSLGGAPWYLGQPADLRGLFTRLLASPHTLGTASERISQGIKTGRDKIFVLHDAERRGKVIRGRSKALNRVVEVEADSCKWLIKSAQMRRYLLLAARRVVLFPYHVSAGGDATIIPFSKLETRWPLAAEYLAEHEMELREREGGRFARDDRWHQYSRHQNMDLPAQQKIVIADVLNMSRFAYDDTASVCFMGGAAGGYGIVVHPPHDPWVVTAVLNSTLSEWLLRPPGLSDWFAGGWFSGESRFIQGLPMLPPDGKGAPELSERSKRLHSAHRRAAEAVTDSERQRWSHVVAVAEEEVDAIVFDAFDVSKPQRAAIQSRVAELRQECGATSAEDPDEG